MKETSIQLTFLHKIIIPCLNNALPNLLARCVTWTELGLSNNMISVKFRRWEGKHSLYSGSSVEFKIRNVIKSQAFVWWIDKKKSPEVFRREGKKYSEGVEEAFLEKVNLRGAVQLTVVFVHPLSHVWLYDPMDCSTSGFAVLHYLLEFAQTHVHWVDDAISQTP